MTRPMDSRITSLLCDRLGLTSEQVYVSKMPADLSFLFTMQNLMRANTGLFYDRRVPQHPRLCWKRAAR